MIPLLPAVHGAALYFAFLIALCHFTRNRRVSDNGRRGFLLPGHTPFWLTTLLLMLIHSLTLVLQILIGSRGDFAPSSLGIIAVSATGLLHRVIETGERHPALLLPILVYHSAVFGITVQGLWPFQNLSSNSVVVQLDFALAIITFNAIITLVWGIGKGSSRSKVPLEEDGIVYSQDTTSLLSRLTFFWFTDLLRIGYEIPLEEGHLGNIPYKHSTAHQLSRFQKCSSSLLWPLLWRVVGTNMAVGGAFRLLADLSGYAAPLGIKTIVLWTARNKTNATDDLTEATDIILSEFLGNGYIIVGLVLLASLLQATFSQCSTYLVNTEGLHVKVFLQGLIYEKSVRVSGRMEETVNLIGEDANNVMMLFWMAHFVWAIPLKLCVLMVLLWQTLGVSALVAAALCILIMIPLQFVIAKVMANNSKALLEKSDERLTWMAEMVGNMRLLKARAWETLFADRLLGIREKELKHLDNDLLFRSLMTFLTHISTVIVTVATFGLYPILEERRLEPSSVFAGLALFNQLTVPLFIFPITVPVVIDALVSGRRIRDFLALPEVDVVSSEPHEKDESRDPLDSNKSPRSPLDIQASTDSVFIPLDNIVEDEEGEIEKLEKGLETNGPDTPDWVLRLNDVTILGDDNQPILSDISLSVPRERLTVIVGPTGSGKTTLIQSLLGELKFAKGSVHWARGRRPQIAYCSQSPWILNGTVRENIIFGRGFRGRRYKKVLEAASLQQDLDTLPEGDATEIGDRGVSLSGGQKQRVALCRALYATAPFVILDDPLSALDVEVATHVFDVGIRKLLANRTVLLVTHHLPVLNHAHHIVALEGGRIRIQGSMSEVKLKDQGLAEHWHDLISKKEAELARHLEAKTAKERWNLLKLVSKIGFQVKRRDPEDLTRGSQHLQSRKGTLSHYKNLSHDFFLPSDEHCDELLAPILRRRRQSRASRESRTSVSSTKHVTLQRMSSLQPSTTSKKVSYFNRLISVPGNNESQSGFLPPTPPHRVRSETNPQPFFKRFFSRPNTVSSGSVELETVGVSPLPPPSSTGPRSTLRSEGEITEEGGESQELLGFSGEEREYGSVPVSVYLIYAASCGNVLSGGYLFFAVGYEVVRVLTSFWLSEWSNDVGINGDNQDEYNSKMSYYFQGYFILSLITVGVSLTCNLIGKAAGARSRRLLHDTFLLKLVDAPLSFFESTPIGRILSRASADLGVVDKKLIISVQRFLQFILLCGSAVVVNGVVNPYFLLMAIPLIGVYWTIQRIYRVSSRELQRIQAISRGPILSHFHETLGGLSTIRCYERQSAFTHHMFTLIDMNNRADMFINVGNRWLSISLDYLGSVIVAVASLGAVLSADFELVSPSEVGLAINYTLLVPVYLNWVVKFLTEVEMFMNSVDRLHRYSSLERDCLEGLESVPSNWPSKGSVVFDKVSVCYEDTPIISSLSLDITEGQKVGVCGRSGCGKSTLLSSLFRLSGSIHGRILIDGVDILQIPVRTLRRSLTIIPQHSALFSAPLRFNLDPSGQKEDKELWEALDLAGLKDAVHQLPNKLDEVMNPGSFSAGQRQLFALSVAILSKSKVVVMDEATSSIDADTEQTLLRVVKDVFSGSTVLSIAHRLSTITTGDRVLVMDVGKILEDGPPGKLLAKKNPRSIFASMLKADVGGML